jgi:hypothetical protein
MAYKNFTMKKLQDRFGLEQRERRFFQSEDIALMQPSSWLLETLEIGQEQTLMTEKAKSEWIVAPILGDLRRQLHNRFRIFSGVVLKADVKQELNGECDFIISHQTAYFLQSAVFALVEAKNDNVDEGLPQCAAQMVGARVFNWKEAIPIDTIFGCVTNGVEWRFLKLEEQIIWLDMNRYTTQNLPQLMGVLQTIIRQYVPEEQ